MTNVSVYVPYVSTVSLPPYFIYTLLLNRWCPTTIFLLPRDSCVCVCVWELPLIIIYLTRARRVSPQYVVFIYIHITRSYMEAVSTEGEGVRVDVGRECCRGGRRECIVTRARPVAGQFRSDGRGGEGWSSAESRGVRVYKQAASFCRLFRSY